MASTNEAIANVQKKIDRENALINAANAMRQSTNNPAVLSRLDAQIKDGHRNIGYFNSKLVELEAQRTTSGMDYMSLQAGGSGSRKANNPLTPPPKDGGFEDQGGYGSMQGRTASGDGSLNPPHPPFAHPPPGASNKRPNYSKLGM
jgi:hypothetical protein